MIQERETFLITKEELDKMTRECVLKIREKKEEHMKVFDSLIKDATKHKREVKKKIEQGITAIDESLVLLDNVQESVKTSTYNGLVRNQEAFESISESVAERLEAVGTSRYPGYTPSGRQDVCGKLSLTKFEPAQIEPGGRKLKTKFSHLSDTRLSIIVCLVYLEMMPIWFTCAF